MHNLKDIEIKDYRDKHYQGKAAKLGAGVQGIEATVQQIPMVCEFSVERVQAWVSQVDTAKVVGIRRLVHDTDLEPIKSWSGK